MTQLNAPSELQFTVLQQLHDYIEVNVATSSVLHICVLLTGAILKKVSSFRGIVLCNVIL